MHIGSFVRVPNGGEGIITAMCNMTCTVELDGREFIYDICELEEIRESFTNNEDDDEDDECEDGGIGIPLFSNGDKVCIGNSPIEYTIIDTHYDKRTYYYSLSNGSDDIVEEEDELTLLCNEDDMIDLNGRNDRYSDIYDYEKSKPKPKIGIVSYTSPTSSGEKYYFKCSMPELTMYLKYRQFFPNLKTHVFKTGMNFPDTGKFDDSDLNKIESAPLYPIPQAQSRIYSFRHDKWGVIEKQNSENYFSIKLDEDKSTYHLNKEDFFTQI